MKDFIELAGRRRSCRAFDARPVEREKLEKCIAAAHLAPSGCNSQPWRYKVVMKPALVKEIAESVQQFGINKYTEKAAAFITVCEINPAKVMKMVAERYGTQAYVQIDLGLSVAHLTLQAAELGLGTCILGVFDEERIKQALDIPDNQKMRMVIAVGYPADGAFREKARVDIAEVAQFVE